MTTTKIIIDMSVYGITGKDRFQATVRTTTKTAITGYGKYFPTHKQAQAYLKGITV